MIWGPFLLALALGLIVSAGLYFAYLWPDVEPDDEAVDAASAGTVSTASAVDAKDKSDSTTGSDKATDTANEKANDTDDKANGASESA